MGNICFQKKILAIFLPPKFLKRRKRINLDKICLGKLERQYDDALGKYG